MSTPTKNEGASPRNKRKEWLWFIGLWLAGLSAALTLGYTIKFLMSLI